MGITKKIMVVASSILAVVVLVLLIGKYLYKEEFETIKFGSYPQSDITGNIKEPIEWIVLDRQEGKVLLLSKHILDCKCYNNECKDVTWETCSLRNWLNNDFYYQTFSDSEQNRIQMINVINNDNSEFGTIGGNNTNDKVFCLSIDEVKHYFYQYDMQSDNKRLATCGTNYSKNVDNSGNRLYVSNSSDKWYFGNSCFWLRSPGLLQEAVAIIGDGGYLGTGGGPVNMPGGGIRPAIWISN